MTMQTMPATDYTFRTKTGLCTITPEQIVLTRTGLRGGTAAAVHGNSILRSAIQSVEAHPPRPPLTRGYFTVHFLEDGKERQRLIMLPGSLSNGQEEYEQAVAALRAAGLLVRG